MAGDFTFKKFHVKQEKGVFALGTDAVLLGVFVHLHAHEQVLEVGTGTGVIALMLAQRFPNVQILAIDANTNAATLAEQNVLNSPFSAQIKVVWADINDFKIPPKITHIVSNPPFFESSMPHSDAHLQQARHQEAGFKISRLFQVAAHSASLERISIIAPYHQKDKLIKEAKQYGFAVERLWAVKPTPEKAIHRMLVTFHKTPNTVCCEYFILIVEKIRHIYSTEFNKLTEDFYL
jgi:tRNA1Val (adenine37-N6)-methyltransferase